MPDLFAFLLFMKDLQSPNILADGAFHCVLEPVVEVAEEIDACKLLKLVYGHGVARYTAAV